MYYACFCGNFYEKLCLVGVELTNITENFTTASTFQMCAIVSDKLITLDVKLVQISTLLAGVSFGYMLIKCYISMLYYLYAALRICQDHLSYRPLDVR